jgi:hypothetical protein
MVYKNAKRFAATIEKSVPSPMWPIDGYCSYQDRVFRTSKCKSRSSSSVKAVTKNWSFADRTVNHTGLPFTILAIHPFVNWVARRTFDSDPLYCR